MDLLSAAWTGGVGAVELLWQSIQAFILWFSRAGGGAPHAIYIRAFIAYLVTAMVGFVLLSSIHGRMRPVGLGTLFPRSIYFHKSSWTDLFLAILARFRPVPFAFILTWVASSSVLALWQQAIPGMPKGWMSPWMMGSIQIVVIFLARDFAEFFRHYLAHKIHFLWALHRVHHSAEILTPLTGYARFHPLEPFTKATIVGTVSGGIIGTALFILGIPAEKSTLGIMLLVNFIAYLAGLFSHSHVWVSFGKFDYFITSPSLHHIHHSFLAEHRDKNFAGTLSLSIWDRLFGTLYVPKTREIFPLGISAEEVGEANPHNNFVNALIEPLFYLVGRKPPRWSSRSRSSIISIMSDGSSLASRQNDGDPHRNGNRAPPETEHSRRIRDIFEATPTPQQ